MLSLQPFSRFAELLLSIGRSDPKMRGKFTDDRYRRTILH